jgi:hypothetical protein
VVTRNTGKACFLNFSQNWKTDFTAVIFVSDFPKFPPNPESYYKGKRVRVTGRVQEYQGSWRSSSGRRGRLACLRRSRDTARQGL